MPTSKVNPIDFDAAAEADRFGALAISRRPDFRTAKMTKYGLTTAQLKVLLESASNVVYLLKRAHLERPRKSVHVGKVVLQLTEKDNSETIRVRGMKVVLAH